MGEEESGGSDLVCSTTLGGGKRRRTDPTGRRLGEKMHSVHPILRMARGHKLKKGKLPWNIEISISFQFLFLM